jgi:uncharacterized protein
VSNIIDFFDPWLAPADELGGQSSRLQAYCQIVVDGVDITSRLEPFLVSVTVYDGATFHCDIELDDRDGRLPIPPWGAPVNVTLGWQGGTSRTWNFKIVDIEHGFGRKQGGRRMWVHCWGIDLQFTLFKTPMQQHMGEGAPPGSEIGLPIELGAWLNKVVGNAGGSISVNPKLASIERDYWAMVNESPLHHIERMASELGAVWRVEGGNQAVFTLPGEDTDGNPMGNITAEWGKNLIAWRVRPWAARSSWKQAHQQHFDTVLGDYQQLAQQFGLPSPFGDGDSMFSLPAPAPNAQVGSQQNQGIANLASAYQGAGRITINGEPAARWNGNVVVIGARPGVDGTYKIDSADHTYSRQGYVTYLEVTTWGTNSSGIPTSQGEEPPPSVSEGYPQAAPGGSVTP